MGRAEEAREVWQGVIEPRDQTEDQSAHGAFGDKAHAMDPQLWLSVHRREVLAGMAATAAAGVGALAFWLRGN